MISDKIGGWKEFLKLEKNEQLYSMLIIVSVVDLLCAIGHFQALWVWALEMSFKSSSSCGWDDDINDQCAGTSTNEVFRVDLEDVQGIRWFICLGF